MGFVVFLLEEVGVVGGDDGEPQLFCQLEYSLVEGGLALGVVGLNLQVVPVLEGVCVPGGG